MERRIKELITEKISGEWGEEASDGEGVAVIRTANFTNEGVIDFEKIVYRKVDSKKIKEKKLRKGDIIIEKSGGSPTQPVGRVVYFDLNSSEDYLCNNFTSVLRSDLKQVYPKYVFYQLFIAHSRGRTLKYQNKTTGIINLKLDKYLNEKIYVPSLPDQICIATLLSKAEALITQRKESIKLLDEYIKSVFVEMFGDPVKNEKKWEKVSLSNLGSLDRGVSKSRPRNLPELLGGKYPLIQTGEVSNSGLYITSYTQTYSDLGLKQSKLWKKGTMLITIAANIAQTSILTFDACFPDSIVGFIADGKETNTIYVHYLFSFFQQILEKNAPKAAQKNINLALLRNLSVPKPPLSLQEEFAVIVEKVEIVKKQFKQSLQELESLFGSLSQQAFKGELDLRKVKSKSFEEEIKKTLKGGEQIEPVAIPQNNEKEDTRYSDPFEVDEGTAKKQGSWFYNEWLLVHGRSIEEKDESIWLQSKRSGLTPASVKFTAVEGDAIINEVFSKQNLGFGFGEFEALLKTEKIAYSAKEVKDFIFQKLEQKELVQYYASKEWMEEMRQSKFNPSGGSEFSGEGSIWFLLNKTEKAK